MPKEFNYFILYECCRICSGVSQGLIMDLQRNEYITIPNLLCEILSSDLRNLTIEQLKAAYDNKYDKGLDKYIKYLIDEEYGFITSEPERFPKMKLDYKSPYLIERAVIEIGDILNYDLKFLFDNLIELGVQYIQLRFVSNVQLDKVVNLLNNFDHSSVKLIELIIDTSHWNSNLEHLLTKDLRFLAILCSKEKMFDKHADSTRKIYIQKSIKELPFDDYSLDSHISTTSLYIEATNRNLGLNSLVAIDKNGFIKNYLTHEEKFGNLSLLDSNGLKHIILSKEFQKKWKITNDMIIKCNKCQYRYMCQSNSDIFINNEGVYEKTNYCSYDL